MAEEARALAPDQGQQLSRCLDTDMEIKADVEGLLAGEKGDMEELLLTQLWGYCVWG